MMFVVKQAQINEYLATRILCWAIRASRNQPSSFWWFLCRDWRSPAQLPQKLKNSRAKAVKDELDDMLKIQHHKLNDFDKITHQSLRDVKLAEASGKKKSLSDAKRISHFKTVSAAEYYPPWEKYKKLLTKAKSKQKPLKLCVNHHKHKAKLKKWKRWWRQAKQRAHSVSKFRQNACGVESKNESIKRGRQGIMRHGWLNFSSL